MAIVAIFPYHILKPHVADLTFANMTDADENRMSWNPLGLFNYFLATLYIVLFLGGLIGNVWAVSVILSLMKNRSQEPPRNVQLYILVLCIIDIFVLVFMIFTIDDALHGEWTMLPSDVLCKLYLCSELLNKVYAPFILMALSGTCYMVVCKRQCRGFPDDLRAGGTIVTVAGGVLIILMVPVYIYGGLHYVVVYDQASSDDNSSTSVVQYLALKCMFQMGEGSSGYGRVSDFVLYTFIVGYALPAAAFTIFYCLLWQYVRRHSWRARSLVNSWRVARTVIGLVSFFLLCWTPFWIMLLYTNARPQYKAADRSPVTLSFSYFVHLLPYINCLGYPLIYIMLNRKIKENYELIRAKRRSQILALCGLRKASCRRESKRPNEKCEAKTSIVNLPVPTDTNREPNGIIEIGDADADVFRPSSSMSRSEETGSRISVDSQSLFANVNELMELSRHMLIPLIEISGPDAAPKKEPTVYPVPADKHMDLKL